MDDVSLGDRTSLDELLKRADRAFDLASADYHHLDEALAAHDEVIGQLDAPNAEGNGHLAAVLLQRATLLARGCRHGEAWAAYDRIIQRFLPAPDPAVWASVAEALVERAGLDRRARFYDYETVIRQYGSCADPAVQVQVARAFIAVGDLHWYENLADLIAAYDEVIARFALQSTGALAVKVSLAMFRKGLAFSSHDEYAQAYTAYNNFISWGEVRPEPVIKRRVHSARKLAQTAAYRAAKRPSRA